MIDTHKLKKRDLYLNKSISRYRTCKSCYWNPQMWKIEPAQINGFTSEGKWHY